MTLPEGRSGQWLAFGILLFVVLAIFRLLFMPAGSWYLHIQSSIQAAIVDIQGYQDSAQHLSRLQHALQEAEYHKSLRPFLWSGENHSLAAASLQHFLQNLISTQQGQVLSTRVLPSVDQGTLAQIALQAEFYSTVTALQAIIHSIENHQPFLLIDQLNILVKPKSSDNRLDVRITILGFRNPLPRFATAGPG